MPMNQKEALFDVRTVNRNLATGMVQRAEVDAHLTELEDCSEQADWTTTRMSKPPEPEADETAPEA